MKVFISWSGQRSKIFAEHFRDLLQRLLFTIEPWMSSKDIEKGTMWNQELFKQLADISFGVICVTPENQTSPWLMFESGAISKTLGKARIFPVLIGMEPEELNSPLKHYQATLVDRNELFELIRCLNKLLPKGRIENQLREDFDSRWETFYTQLKTDLDSVLFQSPSMVFSEIVEVLKKKGLKPQLGNIVQFQQGFESHDLYGSICQIATSRLYILGRKNRKLFDKDRWNFLKSLKEKTSNGFDFKCLFLDPDSPEHILSTAHEDDDFKTQLIKCLGDAKKLVRENDIPAGSFKLYDILRAYSVIIADEAVLFKPMEVSSKGKVKRLTNSSFTLTSTNTAQGKNIEEYFNAVWGNSKEMF